MALFVSGDGGPGGGTRGSIGLARYVLIYSAPRNGLERLTRGPRHLLLLFLRFPSLPCPLRLLSQGSRAASIPLRRRRERPDDDEAACARPALDDRIGARHVPRPYIAVRRAGSRGSAAGPRGACGGGVKAPTSRRGARGARRRRGPCCRVSGGNMKNRKTRTRASSRCGGVRPPLWTSTQFAAICRGSAAIGESRSGLFRARLLT